MQKRNYPKSVQSCLQLLKVPVFMRVKVFAIFLLSFCFQLQGKSYAQINIHESKINVLNLLNEVERQSKYQFFFNNAEIKNLGTVTANFRNSNVTDVLNLISKEKNVDYTIIDRTIVLKKRAAVKMENAPTPKEVFADIKGRVVDDKNKALEGVSVKVKTSTKGTMTDKNGNFTLAGVEPGNTIVFSIVGYKNAEYPANQIPPVVILQKDEQELESVTVVAYGTRTKADLTGSISTVKGDAISGAPRVGIQESLQGNVAGLQASNGDGQPGSLPTIRIRGIGSINANSQPLYVIDGIPIESADFTGFGTNSIAGISNSDVESISILKDASAASLYGSRAANGVILITTKSGKSGKTKINISLQNGFNQNSMLKRSQPLSTPEMLELLREGWVNAGKDLNTFTKDVIVANGIDTTINTDWLKELTRRGKFAQYDVNLSGGNENNSFYFSTSYLKSESVLREVDYDRLTGKLNLTNKVTPKLKMDVNMLFSYQKANTVLDASSFENPVYYMQRLQPWAPVRDANGDYVLEYSSSSSDINPRAQAEASLRQGITYSFMPGGKLKYQITDNLSFESNANLNLNMGESIRYRPTYFTSSALTNGSGSKGINKMSSWISSSLLKYNTVINEDHRFDALLGFEAQKTNFSGSMASATNFLPGTIYLDGASTPQTASSYFRDNSIVSVFANANYNYLRKYYFTVSARRDGSSKFYGSDNMWGNFYSLGFSWNMDREKFIENLGIFSQLKLRTSFGENGNQDIGNYAAMGLYSMNRYDGEPALVYSQINNDRLTWEKNKPFDIGLDFGILNNRLSGSFDFFSRVTSDLLYNLPIPASNGVLDYNKNIGSMKNVGVEVALSSKNVVAKRPGGFTWSTDFNITTYKNTIIKLPSPLVDSYNKREEGQDFYQFYLVGYAGVDKQTGEALWYTDGNKNKTTTVYNEAERAYQGSALPKFFGGLSNSLSYKNFSLSAQIYFNWGNKVWHDWARYTETDGNLTTNIRGKMSRQIYDYRWQKPGDDALLPKIVYGGTQSSVSDFRSTRYLYDGSYIRLRDVTLAYDFKMKNQILNAARVYVRGGNLVTILKDKRLAFDPEVPVTGQLSNKPPLATTFILGIDFKF